MINIVYYRKMAEIAHRDGNWSTRTLAKRVLAARNPRKSDLKKLVAWFRFWLDRLDKPATISTITVDMIGDAGQNMTTIIPYILTKV